MNTTPTNSNKAGGPVKRPRRLTLELLAAEAAGREVRRAEIYRDGKIVLVMIEPSEDAEPKPDRPAGDIVL